MNEDLKAILTYIGFGLIVWACVRINITFGILIAGLCIILAMVIINKQKK